MFLQAFISLRIPYYDLEIQFYSSYIQTKNDRWIKS